MAKISGPLLDRIDLHIEVPAVPFKELSGASNGTTSWRMRDAVISARAVQRAVLQFAHPPKRSYEHARAAPSLPLGRRRE